MKIEVAETLKVRDDFNIERLITDTENFGYNKWNSSKYVYFDITVPIVIDLDKREVQLGECKGLVSRLFQIDEVKHLRNMKVI